MRTVDIVIPTYGQPEFTAKCFASIAATCHPEDVRVIWVDNGSAGALGLLEHSASLLEVGGFSVERILLQENFGFIKATNLGMAASSAPYVMLLNNDTELPAGWFQKMLAPFSNQAVGIVGPRSSAPTQWQSSIEARAGWSVEPTRTISFFCAVIRRAVITKIGYLSEEFGVGFADDDDYCTRARAAGFSVALVHDCTVLHHHRVTFTAVYGQDEWKRMLLRSREVFYNKYHSTETRRARVSRRLAARQRRFSPAPTPPAPLPAAPTPPAPLPAAPLTPLTPWQRRQKRAEQHRLRQRRRRRA
jgi:GT2 family glycosyltransferase